VSIRQFFLWTRHKLTRLEVYEHDLEKKPEIPDASGPVQRLKAAVEEAHQRRRRMFQAPGRGRQGEHTQP